MRHSFYIALAWFIFHASYADDSSLTRLPDMNSPRAAHQTTQISDSEWLISGGCIDPGCETVSHTTEIFRYPDGSFVSAPAMNERRASHRAIAFDDGTVLLLGGWTGIATTASAERYDHRQKRFVFTASMHSPRMGPAAIKLANGDVFIAGGERATGTSLASAERYDSAKQQFIELGNMNTPRSSHAAAMLADGRVLITGGQRGRNQLLDSAEIFDPKTGTFTETSPMLGPRYKHAAVTLADGRVMVIGGSPGGDYQNRLGSTEIFDPRTGKFTAGPTLQNVRFKIHDAAVVLANGAVVIAGGSTKLEKWAPGAVAFEEIPGAVTAEYAFSTNSLLPGGKLLVIGGYDHRIRPTASAWLVKP